MTYKRFENLPVWQKAAELYGLTEQLLENPSFRASHAFRDQLEGAALSVSNNIAEGFERVTTRELLTFIYIARDSAGEVRSMLSLEERRGTGGAWQTDLNSQISDLKLLAEGCARHLRGWADALQNSDIQGRHLNAKSQAADEARKRAQSCRKVLLSKLPDSHPLVRDARERGLP